MQLRVNIKFNNFQLYLGKIIIISIEIKKVFLDDLNEFYIS